MVRLLVRLEVRPLDKDMVKEINDEMIKKTKSRGYKFEPYELEGMAKVAAKIVSIITTCAFSNPYEKGRVILSMVLDMLDRAEGHKQ